VHAQAVQLLHASAVDLAQLEEGSDVPDVDESNATQLSAPLHGDADAIEEGEEPVGPRLAEVEAAVCAFPHAVKGVGSLGLGEHILERDLDVIVDVVGVTVDHIEIWIEHGHGCGLGWSGV